MTPPGDAPDPLSGGSGAEPAHDRGEPADAPDRGAGDGGDDGPDGDDGDAGSSAAGGEPEAAGEGGLRRRRRRRRRRGADGAPADGARADGPAGERPQAVAAPGGRGEPDRRHPPARAEPGAARGGRTDNAARTDGGDRNAPAPRNDRSDGNARGDRNAPNDRNARRQQNEPGDRSARGGADRGGGNERNARAERNDPGNRNARGERSARGERPDRGDRGHDGAGAGGADAGERRAEPLAHGELERSASSSGGFEAHTARLDARGGVAPADDLDADGPAAPSVAWGQDDDGPAPEVALAADLPEDAPADDPDPVSYPLTEPGAVAAALGDDIASIAGVRFVAGGRVQWCDAGEVDYAHGERVVVDSERGTRLAWIAVAPSRRAVRDRGMRRVIRRANDQDLRGERSGDADRAHALRLAKDKAAALRMPLKVFRVELFGQLGRGARLNVYYTSDERLDLRDFIRELSSAIGGRIELRQLGVRDEAKAVGGIGSCGLTLCCTTWLPDFVPVSIKMAKDQGLVLSPTKVSGQCGRLKCCLVYEQAGYAELRKGLPKLGKRVIGARGEGRVVEVDVLRQRIRVSYGPGDTEVVPATEVKPMFPSGNQPRARGADAETGDDASDDAIDAVEADGAGGLPDDDSIPPDDDPSSVP